MSLNGSLNGHQDPEEPKKNNPGDSPASPGNSESSPLPAAAAPVQLAFGFDLAPQEEGHKIPWAKRLKTEGLSYYPELYQDLLVNPPGWETQFWLDHPNRKREWPKKAVYIAWACAPAKKRKPRTQKEVAEMLGITPAAICLWKSKNPEMVELIQERTLGRLEEAVAGIDDVTIEQAEAPDSPPAARKLFYDRYEQARAARLPMNPQQIIQIYQNVIKNINWDSLTPEQTERIVAGEDPFMVVLASGVGVGNGLSG